MHAMPPSRIVCCAPMRLARNPPSKLPIGAVPRKAMVYNAMTRPRSRSSTIVWSTVFVDAISTIIPAPTKGRMTSDSQSECDRENAVSPRPKVIVASTITRPSPITDVRDAR